MRRRVFSNPKTEKSTSIGQCHSIKHIQAISSPVESPYARAARNRTLDEHKERERSKVARHILDHLQFNNFTSQNTVIQTNPGIHWNFERMIEFEIGEYKAHFLGLEKDWPIIEFGLQYMPGRKKTHVSRSGEDFELKGCVSRKAAIFHSEVCAWPDIYKASLTTCELNATFYRTEDLLGISAAWIDIFGPAMTPKFALALRDISERSIVDTFPYAVTCLYGRDRISGVNFGSVDSRAEAIASELSTKGKKAFPTDSWWYYGLNDCRMMTTLGILRRDKPND